MIIFFFLLFLVAGVVHIFLGHFADGGLLLGLAAFLGFVAYFIGREAKERRAFLEWLKAKQPDIEKGWSYYRGLKITPQTEVTQYQACMSFIIITSRFRSRFLLVGRDPSFTRFTFTLVTFIFGWWGFPWALSLLPKPSTAICVAATARPSPNFFPRSTTSSPAAKSPSGSRPFSPTLRPKPADNRLHG